MSDNDAMKKLLYAILKQKCLKDVDWNKVADDPVLTTNGHRDITNGHAARMRYSRFKKQMEGGNAPSGRRPRAPPASPKKPRQRGVKKDSPSKRVKTERKASSGSGSGVGVKSEPGREMSGGVHGEERGRGEVGLGLSLGLEGGGQRRQSNAIYPLRAEDEIRIKHEPGLRSSHYHQPNNNDTNHINGMRASSVLMMPTPNPSTPRYSPSPSPSEGANHSFQNGMGDLGDAGGFGGSFGMAGFSPATAEYLRGSTGGGGEGCGGVGSGGGGGGYETPGRVGYGSAGGRGSQEYGGLLGGMGMGMEMSPGMGGMGGGEEFGAGMWSPGLGHGSSGGGSVGMFKEEMDAVSSGGSGHGVLNGSGSVFVKTEQRWEDAYRRV